MQRFNPGPFEPLVYFLQKPISFRIIGVGGFALFTILALGKAAAHGAGSLRFGLALLGALWLESSLSVCRRCRFYGTWHCLGQGMLVSKLFAARPPGVTESQLRAHLGLVAAFLLYGLFWLWHSPILGLLFTLWVPLALISALPPGREFSWREPARTVQAGSETGMG